MAETVTKKLALFFPQCECEKPIVCDLVRDYGLTVNIFRAKVTPDEEGYLVLDVTGEADAIDKALAYVRTFDVTINDAGLGLVWDDTRCTHCGNCLTHCPTHALHVADESSRRVAFDAEACIECLACMRACPFGACSSPF